jgi:hypothetical protein
MEDCNRRFGRAPQNPHDAHRPLQDGDDLSRIFSWQVERTVSRNLTVYFKRVTYLVEPGPSTLPFGGKRVRVHEWDDGRVEIYAGGSPLPYSIFDQHPRGAADGKTRLGGPEERGGYVEQRPRPCSISICRSPAVRAGGTRRFRVGGSSGGP